MPLNLLDGHVVLVTGAAGTLGRAVVGGVTGAGGTAFRTDIRGTVDRDIDHIHDVTSEDDWRKVVGTLGARFGRLDGLVNNAGVLFIGSIETTSLAEWRRVMSVNADGVFLGCHYAWDLLKKSTAASIVNVSSVSGLVGGANLAAYNASKGAVRLLTKSVGLHGARQKPPIRCNSVHPSFVQGAMAETALATAADPERARATMTRDIPMTRLARPEEIANSIVFLLSSQSSFTTAAEFVIDGGLTAR